MDKDCFEDRHKEVVSNNNDGLRRTGIQSTRAIARNRKFEFKASLESEVDSSRRGNRDVSRKARCFYTLT